MDKPIFIHMNTCTFMYYMILMTMYNCTQWSPARGLDRDSIKQQRLWSPKWTRFHFWNAWSFDHHHPFRWPIFPELLEPGCWHSPMHNRLLCFSLSSQPKPNKKKKCTIMRIAFSIVYKDYCNRLYGLWRVIIVFTLWDTHRFTKSLYYL